METSNVNIFSSTSGLNITLELICHKAKLMLNSDWTTCFAPNSKTGKMRALVNWGLSQGSFSDFQGCCSKLKINDFVGNMDIQQQSIFNPNKDECADIFLKINEYTPVDRILISRCTLYGQLFGYMAWGYNHKKSIPRDSLDRAEPFADQAALALKYNQLDKVTRRQNARLAALLDLSTTIYSSLNYREVLSKVAVYAKDLVGADSCSIYILKKYSGELEPLVVKDSLYSKQLLEHIIKPNEGITGEVISESSGKVVNASDENKNVLQIPGIPVKPSSLMSVPLKWSNEILGAITLRKWETGNFSKGDLDILMIFARQAADAIENARLFESLEKAYNELSAAQEQLIMSEKLRALGEMAGGIAHDFNNVLGVVLGKSQLIQRFDDIDKIKESIKIIEEAANSGASTVKRIQEFARVSAQGSESEIDINLVINEAIEVTKARWKDEVQRKGIFIEFQLELNAKKPVLGVFSDLREVMSNFILNAVDALPNGGKLCINTEDKDSFLNVVIRDEGTGMDEETAKKVFFPFFTTKSSQGTGLGLAVAYGIITRHKGDISVNSKIGEGTTFTISIPHRIIEQSAEAEDSSGAVSDQKVKVLVIDDDENIRSILYEMLCYSGHKVVTAADGKEGINKFGDDTFDMVFTDLGMPEITGWDVAQEIKRKDKNMPVVLISGWGAQLEDDVLEDSGVDFVVAKPFHLEKILDVIGRSLLLKEGKIKQSSPVRL
ncbi:MAG: response regulator [candidate division Zixibacteria bacterium]|nr:response regulator [candidate division Zixibacteria bacterium]